MLKKSLLLILIISSIFGRAQDTLDLKGINRAITITLDSTSHEPFPKPSYVLIFRNKQLLLNNDFKTRKSGIKVLEYLHLNSIKRLTTIQGIPAIHKYGTFGNKGVVEIFLKRNFIKNLPPEIIAEFIPLRN